MDPEIDPAALFRPVKRRKFQRRRPDVDGEEDAQSATAGQPAHVSESSTPPSWQESPGPFPAIDPLRSRRLHRARKGGIEFSATSRPATSHESQAVVSGATMEDLDKERMRAMCDRFTAHTGQTVDVDKHMMAYIETEMAKRHRCSIPTETTGFDPSRTSDTTSALSINDLPQREPASLGKLHEIDLGHEATLQNIARTQAATRRLAMDDDHASLAEQDPGSRMSAVGKDQKSGRNRRWRTNEDIERDRVVEEVLRESKLDVYEGPEELGVGDVGDADGQAADDRVAEQFRRDFLDAIQSRRRVARARNTKVTKPDAPRGPKLGGSRSARAAMREMQEKAGRK
ncbi:hypothetical protein BO70DRAFT_203521 [Aspergillus heteromorphus CBS 117.55]|uniref:Hepatocellular carcinoma-associated antigen 59-domain-containing protein n=1 Tax=Aspergillus heteromorphus CBS 117.55 TaxID=1448321 RepID=A0A317UVP4_9EURO|nr:uncharacterized protein BO70DRAFT_203521 [Aspergillus heteromorphus CBS 117.55]PWY64542.1 hypothetical protein BO70DRAFT_203521 [Aspergillus heteromorphus CBS 117.55]